MSNEIKTWRSTPEASQCHTSWDAIALADREIAELRAALAASGGNAAPELTDERAAFEADTLDLYPVATFNRFPNSENYNVNWVQEQWGGWQRRAKYAAASAPNAALVAALRKIKQNETEVFDEAMGEMVIVGLDAEEMVAIAADALSAAGQEVGHG